MRTLLLILIFCGISNAQVVKIKQEIHDKIKYNDAEVTQDYTKLGSGIVVGNTKTDSFVLTCRHVHHPNFEKFKDLTVVSGDKSYPGTIIKTYYLADLALIKVPNTLLPSIKIAKKALKPGDYCEYRGFPDGGDLQYRRGYVKTIDDKIDYVYTGTKTVFVDLQAKGGESGSGVLNNLGELAGIVCAQSPATCHIIGLPDLEIFLNGELK
jgi:S1-C subfamily serine protease